jgi:hypothetical protein
MDGVSKRGLAMTKAVKSVIVPPDAARLALGMRDMGYSFAGAIADLVDNSIAAEAKNIHIYIEPIFPAKVRVLIVDDGLGMNLTELQSAMKYGAPAHEDKKSLNKFGLGLKTASSSFSKRFTVITRKENEDVVNRATWDIDKIAETNEWVLEIGEADQQYIDLLNKATLESGTAVLWDNIDRLLNEKQRKDDKVSRRAISKHEEELVEHLSRVFQRYLDPVFTSNSHVSIFVNDKKLSSWDPFCTSEVDTTVIYDGSLDIDLPNGKSGAVKVRGYILPRKEKFSTPEAATRARINNDNQGIYIYRENRLIHGPDWQGIYRSEPHYSLARIEFSFNHDLDDMLEVDVQKSKINLETDIKAFLEDHVLPQIRTFASQRYRDGQIAGTTLRSKGLHNSANVMVGQVEEDVSEVKIVTTNQSTGEATLENRNGEFTIRLLKPEESKKDEPFITPQESLRDGVLWEPVISENRKAVALSMSHPFYNRVYLPSKQKDVVIQSFDYLIWALALGEMNTMNDKVKHFYEQLRIDVGRILRHLSETLPEAGDDD